MKKLFNIWDFYLLASWSILLVVILYCIFYFHLKIYSERFFLFDVISSMIRNKTLHLLKLEEMNQLLVLLWWSKSDVRRSSLCVGSFLSEEKDIIYNWRFSLFYEHFVLAPNKLVNICSFIYLMIHNINQLLERNLVCNKYKNMRPCNIVESLKLENDI